LLGFDIVTFDEFMQTERGYIEDDKTSLSDFIKQKYGKRGRDVYETLNRDVKMEN
jgi:hypothetical protein